MKGVIKKMDRALKQLYQLDHEFRAERFLISEAILPATGRGALFIQKTPQDLNVAIFLDTSVREQLTKFGGWSLSGWNFEQLDAFSVAAEEVSHFNYFIHHQTLGRAVSQLELEAQGEIDKFLLTLFSGNSLPDEKELIQKFEMLLEQFFQRYRLVETLTPEQKERYLHASQLAQAFLTKYRDVFSNPRKVDKALKLLRRFYRLNLSEKVSLSQP